MARKKKNLTEGVSSVAYHATSISSAKDILKTKAFKLAGTYGTRSEWEFSHDKKQTYFMSVTRSKLGSFHRKKDSGVMFVLNGDWFNRNYKSKPVDYFQRTLDPKVIKKKAEIMPPKAKGREFEDRIFSDEAQISIPNLRDLIKEIHVLIPSTAWTDEGSDTFGLTGIRDFIKTIKLQGLEDITWYYGGDFTDNPENYKSSMAVASSKARAAKEWLKLSKKGTTTPSAMEKLIKLNIPVQAITRKLGWAPQFKREKWAVPFGQKPSEYDGFGMQTRVSKKHRSELANTMDHLYVWREFFHTKPENVGNLSVPSKETLKEILRKFETRFRHNFEQYRDHNQMEPPIAWLDTWKERFTADYSNYRHVSTDSLTRAKDKLNELVRKTGKTIDHFGQFVGALWWKVGYKYILNTLEQEEKERGYLKVSMEPEEEAIHESHIARSLVVYHGSNKKFDKFSAKAKRVTNDFYGGGIAYTTDDKNVALTYSRAMTYRYGGEEYLYQLHLNLKNIFDVDTVFTGKELTEFLKYIKPEEFLRSAGLLTPGEDKYAIMSKLSSGNLMLNGKEVFKGLSKGLVDSSGAEAILKKMGFDGLRYNGGDNMGTGRHNVYIPYYENSIKIEKTFKVQRKRPVNEDTGIGHMIFARATLPQVRDYNEFLSHMNLIGADYDVGRMDAGKLKATQLDGFDAEKVEALKKEKDVDPIIVSSDDFILDGHHRWLARKELGKSVPVYKIALPILELIRVARDFYKIDYSEDITELFAGLQPTLYNHLDFVKLKYSLGNNILEGRWHHSIPLVHIKDGLTGKRTREVTGTSLTRNPNLDFDQSYHYMFELDRNRISQTNKIHVIDADNVAYGNNPHSSEASRGRTRNNVRASWKQSMNSSLTKGAPIVKNDFAEEFVEGNLKPLNKYLKAIWLKPTAMYSTWGDNLSVGHMEAIEELADYSVNYGVPIKLYPSGKDISGELIDIAARQNPTTKSYQLGNLDYKHKPSLSKQLVNIRKSINTE